MGADGKAAEGLSGWDLLAVLAFLLVFLSLVGVTYRTDQLETPPGWMAQPISWLSVSWFPPKGMGWVSDWHWLRIVPWATGLALLSALLVRVPAMVAEDKPGPEGDLHDPTYVVRHNGIDTPHLDHLSCVLWTTPGDHEKLLERLDAFALPKVAGAVKMVPLNTRASEGQQDQAEKGRSLEGLG